MSDVLLLEIQGREKPAVVLTEAHGGPEFMAELLKRELFPQKVFDKAISSTDGTTHCWPPDTK